MNVVKIESRPGRMVKLDKKVMSPKPDVISLKMPIQFGAKSAYTKELERLNQRLGHTEKFRQYREEKMSRSCKWASHKTLYRERS